MSVITLVCYDGDYNAAEGCSPAIVSCVTYRDADLQLSDTERLTTDETRHHGEVWDLKLFGEQTRLLSVSHDRSIRVINRQTKQLELCLKQAHLVRVRGVIRTPRAGTWHQSHTTGGYVASVAHHGWVRGISL